MNIVIIAPHPDDEVLGCGGTLLKHKENGDSIHIVYITFVKESDGYSSKRVASRLDEVKRIQAELQAEVFHLSYTPTSLTDQDVPELVSSISDIFKEIKPEVVYLPNRSDAHSDHGVCFKAAFSCPNACHPR